MNELEFHFIMALVGDRAITMREFTELYNRVRAYFKAELARGEL